MITPFWTVQTQRLIAVLGAFLLAFVSIWATHNHSQAQTRHMTPPHQEEVIIMPTRIIAPPNLPSHPIKMKNYDIDVAIKDNMATTTIEQVFENNTKQTLQAKYMFPLPEGANFSSFNVTINGQQVEGKLMERDAARRKYYAIVRKLIDPGLLEFIDHNTVQLSVAPIFAGEKKVVRITYNQLLKKDGGLHRYQYPFVGKASQNIPIESASLKAQIKTASQLKTVYSPTHEPKIKREGKNKASLSINLNDQKSILEKNFVLYVSQDNQTLSLNSLSYKKPSDDHGYFMVSIRPPQEILDQKRLPKNMVLAIDTSGSMSGEKIAQAKKALKYVINQLHPEDTFSIVQFNTDVATYHSEAMSANSQNKAKALDYVDELSSGGSTNIEEALKLSFDQIPANKSNRPSYVIFLTDGEPTIGVTDTAGLLNVAQQANTKQAKLFNFGVGYNINTDLLTKLSDANHGSTTFVEPNEDLELALSGFYNKIESPVLADVQVDFGNFKINKTYPREIGDLFAGSEVILVGQYHGNGQTQITVKGNIGNKTQSFTYPVRWENRSTTHNQLPRLWAGRRIGFLLDEIHQNGENTETKEEVVALSKKYGILTPYTSFLSVEQKEGRIANNVPMSIEADEMMDAAPAPQAALRKAVVGSAGAGRGLTSPTSRARYVGKNAVMAKKSMQKMQQQTSNYAADEEQAQNELRDGRVAVLAVRKVNHKIFTIDANGTWVDSEYTKTKHGNPKKLTFGSDAYFDLLTTKPELAEYFSIGQQVLVVVDRIAYQVVLPKASQSTSIHSTAAGF